MFVLLYVVFYPIVLLIAMAFRDEHGSIGDYLVGPYFSAFLWTFVPAILFSIIIDVYKKAKNEQVEEDEASFLSKQEKSQVELEKEEERGKSPERSKDLN